MRNIEIPGGGTLQLEHLVLDVNGTLSDRGVLIEGVSDRLQSLAGDLELQLISADTFGTGVQLAIRLGARLTTIRDGEQKAALVRQLGPDATVAIGNGRNDEQMLRVARLSMAVIGPEGAAATALLAADIVCRSVLEALDLLLDDRALVATLRR